MRLHPILAASAGLFALALVVPVAEAANRYAMTCFENKTDITLNYFTRWGTTAQWHSHSLSPGLIRPHVYELPRTGKDAGRAPSLYVKFDDDLSGRFKQRDYVLQTFGAPQNTDCKKYGKEYQFQYDGTAKKFIDLREVR